MIIEDKWRGKKEKTILNNNNNKAKSFTQNYYFFKFYLFFGFTGSSYCSQAFSSMMSGGYSLFAVHRLLIVEAEQPGKPHSKL